MNLKTEILRRWAECKNEAERDKVLGEVEAARHEIRGEYLWSEPEMRKALATLEGELTAIMRGQMYIGEIHLHEHDSGVEGMRRLTEEPKPKG